MARRILIAAALAVLFGAGFVPAATAHDPGGDIAARDQLIRQQEDLLNTYRCMFSIDTQLVPGGCSDNQTTAPRSTPRPSAAQTVEIVRCYENQGTFSNEAVAEVKITNTTGSTAVYGYIEVGFCDSAGRRVDWSNDLQNVRLAPGQSTTVFVDTYTDAEWNVCRVTEFNWR